MDSSHTNQTKREVNINEEEEQHFSYAMQLVTTGSLPMVLLAAIRLDVFEIIAEAGPSAQLSPSEIATRLSLKNPDASLMLDRMLRLLATHSVLTCAGAAGEGEGAIPRVYGLSPVSKYFVRNPEGASLGALLALLQDKVFTDSWYELEDSVREGGIPFNRVHGTHAFEYPGRDPRFNEVFNKAMIDHTTIVINRILEIYKGFDEHLIRSLVDVGGGLGITLNMITMKYPNIKGINFDLPHVIQHAPAYPGVEHVGGDMFQRVPKGDAIFMKWILHDWDDNHCLKLLKNCHDALSDGGKVIVVDALLPAKPGEDDADTINSSAYGKATCQVDLIMMTQNPGGKERSKEEFVALAAAAGFRSINIEFFVCNLWIMEFYK